jgi:protein-S-isoprenylcysteine O-methyltransferase Ste14
MELTVELAARVVVMAAAATQLLAGFAVLFRQRISRRPAPIERVAGPLALVNYVGLAGFGVVGLSIAVTGIGALHSPAEPLGDAIRAAGVLVLLAAGLLAVAGFRAMGRNLVAPAEVRPDTKLVTSGPFALVRHPMYLSIILLWAGGALALLSPAMALGTGLLVPAFYLRARAEEALLLRHFGDAYAAYAAGVPMLRPRLRRLG